MYPGSSRQMTALKLGLANEVEYYMASGPEDDCGAAPANPSDLRTGFPLDDVCNDASVCEIDVDFCLVAKSRALALEIETCNGN